MADSEDKAQLIARRFSDFSPALSPTVGGLLLVALTAALYGLSLPALDAGVYALLLPLALVLAVVILVRPEIGLMLVFLASPLETVYLDIGVRIKPQQVIGLLTIAGWALQFALARRPVLRGSLLNTPLFLLLLTFLFSFILHSQVISLGISLFVLQLWFIAVIYLAANFVDEPDVLRRCLWMFVAAGVFESVVAIVQAAGFYESAGSFTSYGSILVNGRPPGTFNEPDFLAPFLTGSFLLVLPFWGSKKVGAWLPLIYAAALAILAASILTMVRASWIGLIAGLAAFAWLKLRERGEMLNLGPLLKRVGGVVAAVALICVVLAALSPTAFSAVSVRAKNLLTIVEPENPQPTRLNEISQTWATVKEHLFVGHGVGTFGITTAYGQGIATGKDQTRAGVVGSGTPLGLLHDQGIGGLAAFAFLVSVLLWRLLRAQRKATAEEQVPYLQGAFACLVGLTVSAFFNNLYYFGFYWLVIALAAALAECAAPNDAGSRGPALTDSPD